MGRGAKAHITGSTLRLVTSQLRSNVFRLSAPSGSAHVGESQAGGGLPLVVALPPTAAA